MGKTTKSPDLQALHKIIGVLGERDEKERIEILVAVFVDLFMDLWKEGTPLEEIKEITDTLGEKVYSQLTSEKVYSHMVSDKIYITLKNKGEEIKWKI